MRVSNAGINLIKQFEGLKLKAYRCPANVWTIGYGHTAMAGSPIVTPGMTITQDEANAILHDDLLKYEQSVNNNVKVPLSQNQFDALTSFVYNVGTGNFEKSTLLKKLNAGQYDAVPAELMKWTKGGGKELPGLVRRRRAESAMWRGVDDSAPVDEDARVEPDLPKPSKTMAKSKEGNAALITSTLAGAQAANDAANTIKQTGDSLQSLTQMLMSPSFLIPVLIVVAGLCIWYWRRKRLEEEGA